MKSKLVLGTLFVSAILLSNVALTSCKSYCPGVDGTGNSASRETRRSISLGKSHCPAVAGTGNYKPKLKNKKEDGLTSPKMERQMAKAANKKAGPLESKKLHFD
jgi:hypothetical protein